MRESKATDSLDLNGDWSRETLRRKGAIVRCAEHEVDLISGDEGSFAKAVKEGRRRRPQGLSADAAESLLREYAAGLKTYCPTCD